MSTIGIARRATDHTDGDTIRASTCWLSHRITRTRSARQARETAVGEKSSVARAWRCFFGIGMFLGVGGRCGAAFEITARRRSELFGVASVPLAILVALSYLIRAGGSSVRAAVVRGAAPYADVRATRSGADAGARSARAVMNSICAASAARDARYRPSNGSRCSMGGGRPREALHNSA